MTTLTRDDIRMVMVGATFLGGGGGGPLDVGYQIIENTLGSDYSIELEELKNANEAAYGAMVASLGSPEKIKENGNFGPDGVAAYEAFQTAMSLEGKNVTYMYSGEMGGFNTMVPILVTILANKSGKTVTLLDVDANGRAVPELNTSLNSARGFPSKPIGLGALTGTKCIVFSDEDEEGEQICRALCQLYNSQIGFSTWAMSCNELQGNAVVGCISKAKLIGEKLEEAKNPKCGKDVIDYLKEVMTCRLLVHGQIIDKTVEVVSGFDVGKTKIKDAYSDEEYTIYFQNENLYVTNKAGEVIITAPEVISTVCRDPAGTQYSGQPMDNATTKVGMMVDVILSPADDKWWSEDKNAYLCWKDALKRAGYEGEQVRYTE